MSAIAEQENIQFVLLHLKGKLIDHFSIIPYEVKPRIFFLHRHTYYSIFCKADTFNIVIKTLRESVQVLTLAMLNIGSNSVLQITPNHPSSAVNRVSVFSFIINMKPTLVVYFTLHECLQGGCEWNSVLFRK